MSKYYVGQTLEIDLTMNVDISGSSGPQIKYRKPSGLEGTWTATVMNDETGWIRYILSAGNNDEAGDWIVWGYVVQADATVVVGTPLTIRMNAEGY